jgi:hypothetical protein
MDGNAAEQLLDELLSAMEALETQCAGILQFLKQGDVATQEQLAPYMEQAANASNVRWRAARLRITSLLHSAMKDLETSSRKTEPSAKHAEPAKEEPQDSGLPKDEVDDESAQEAATKDSSVKADVREKTDSAGTNPQTKKKVSTPDEASKASGGDQPAAAQLQKTLQSEAQPEETSSEVTPEPESARPLEVEQKSAKAEKQSEAPKRKPGKENAA